MTEAEDNVETIASAVTPYAISSAGDRVVQAGRTTGTVNTTGAAFDVDEVHILTVRDGNVVRFEAHIDTPAMLGALGAGAAS
jgi:ketosteroid isomerase-like protein